VFQVATAAGLTRSGVLDRSVLKGAALGPDDRGTCQGLGTLSP
jgi:hypothetical protein